MAINVVVATGAGPVRYGTSVIHVGAVKPIHYTGRSFIPNTGALNTIIDSVAEYPRYYSGDATG